MSFVRSACISPIWESFSCTVTSRLSTSILYFACDFFSNSSLILLERLLAWILVRWASIVESFSPIATSRLLILFAWLFNLPSVSWKALSFACWSVFNARTSELNSFVSLYSLVSRSFSFSISVVKASASFAPCRSEDWRFSALTEKLLTVRNAASPRLLPFSIQLGVVGADWTSHTFLWSNSKDWDFSELFLFARSNSDLESPSSKFWIMHCFLACSSLNSIISSMGFLFPLEADCSFLKVISILLTSCSFSTFSFFIFHNSSWLSLELSVTRLFRLCFMLTNKTSFPACWLSLSLLVIPWTCNSLSTSRLYFLSTFTSSPRSWICLMRPSFCSKLASRSAWRASKCKRWASKAESFLQIIASRASIFLSWWLTFPAISPMAINLTVSSSLNSSMSIFIAEISSSSSLFCSFFSKILRFKFWMNNSLSATWLSYLKTWLSSLTWSIFFSWASLTNSVTSLSSAIPLLCIIRAWSLWNLTPDSAVSRSSSLLSFTEIFFLSAFLSLQSSLNLFSKPLIAESLFLISALNTNNSLAKPNPLSSSFLATLSLSCVEPSSDKGPSQLCILTLCLPSKLIFLSSSECLFSTTSCMDSKVHIFPEIISSRLRSLSYCSLTISFKL